MIGYLKRLLGLAPRRPRNGEKIHDYTRQGWGHALHTTGWPKTTLGHGHGIRNGDWIRCKMKSGGIALYRLLDVQYYSDPPDMWKARLATGFYETEPAPEEQHNG